VTNEAWNIRKYKNRVQKKFSKLFYQLLSRKLSTSASNFGGFISKSEFGGIIS
jgi:hypothetical protein